MFVSVGHSYLTFLCRWTSWVRHHARSVCVAALLLSVASAGYLATHIQINTSTSDMLSAELEFRQRALQLDAAFPQTSDTLLIVIDGQTPDIAERAALALVTRMRQKPAIYGGVYDLAGEPFFRRNGLLYLEPSALYDLSDRLAEAQPFLGTLWQDLSLRGLFSLIGKAIEADAQVDAGDNVPAVSLTTMLNAISDVAAAQLQGDFSELSWRQLMQGRESGTNANRRFIQTQPPLDYHSLSPAADAMRAVRQLAVELALTADQGVRVRLSGSVALDEEELGSVEQGMGLAGGLSLVLVIGLLVIGLKRFGAIVATVVTLLMGLTWTAAFAILALGALNLISVAFAVLFIGLSVDFGIHYALRYGEQREAGADHADALTAATSGVGGALTLSAIAAAIAFYSFLPTDYRGLAELGMIAGTGMFIALFANLTVLPALLTLLPGSTVMVAHPTGPGLSTVFAGIIRSRSRPICIMFLLAAVAAAIVAPRVSFDFDPLNLKSPQTESMSTLIDLMADSRTSPYSIEILAPDLAQAAAMAERLRVLDEVASAETLADYVPDDQAEKLDVIATTALFLGPALSGSGGRVELDRQSRRQAVDDLLAILSKSPVSADPTKQQAMDRLAHLLGQIRTAGSATIVDLENRLLTALPAQLNALKKSLSATPVSLADLPDSLRQRQIAADGRARVEVFPRENLHDRAALIRFVTAVRAIAPDAVGSPVVILEAGKTVLHAFYLAGGLSVVVISVLLLIVLGRFGDVALVFAPLILAGVFSLAVSVLFGLSFNFANVIVLPLLFGLGVAGGIHLVSRAAVSDGQGEMLQTSTPRAIVFSALTTIGSFGSIALSGHPGTSSMGLLLTLTVSLTLLCTLVFLPALMHLTGQGGR